MLSFVRSALDPYCSRTEVMMDQVYIKFRVTITGSHNFYKV
jgi:hypothetical protein